MWWHSYNWFEITSILDNVLNIFCYVKCIRITYIIMYFHLFLRFSFRYKSLKSKMFRNLKFGIYLNLESSEELFVTLGYWLYAEYKFLFLKLNNYCSFMLLTAIFLETNIEKTVPNIILKFCMWFSTLFTLRNVGRFRVFFI